MLKFILNAGLEKCWIVRIQRDWHTRIKETLHGMYIIRTNSSSHDVGRDRNIERDLTPN